MYQNEAKIVKNEVLEAPCVQGGSQVAAQPVLFTSLGRGTGPKRSGAVLVCFWTDFQAEPSILDPIRVIFYDLGPNRHFGQHLDLLARDLDLLDQARDWLSPPSLHSLLKDFASLPRFSALKQTIAKVDTLPPPIPLAFAWKQKNK